MRIYENYDRLDAAEIIIIDILYLGKSSGWSAQSLETLDEMKNLLAKFNIVYTSDFNGEWELKK